MIVFDNVRHTIKFIVCARPEQFDTPRKAYDDAVARIDALAAKLRKPVVLPEEPEKPSVMPRLKGNMSRDEYCAMVEKAQKYIHDGEAIQIVLSQKFSAPACSSPLQLYRALRLINPSPYTFFLKTDELTLVGSSPETMVKLENGVLLCARLREPGNAERLRRRIWHLRMNCSAMKRRKPSI